MQQNNQTLIPVSVLAHHALIDGFHISQFFIKLESYSQHNRTTIIVSCKKLPQQKEFIAIQRFTEIRNIDLFVETIGKKTQKTKNSPHISNY
jgi:hypothetical protein